jgi:hypothetical protein
MHRYISALYIERNILKNIFLKNTLFLKGVVVLFNLFVTGVAVVIAHRAGAKR